MSSGRKHTGPVLPQQGVQREKPGLPSGQQGLGRPHGLGLRSVGGQTSSLGPACGGGRGGESWGLLGSVMRFQWQTT